MQVYKQLERVWEHADLAAAHPAHSSKGEAWQQHNTVLIDDTTLKAASQPHNIIEVPEFKGGSKAEKAAQPLRQVAAYLEELRWYADVSAFMLRSPFRLQHDWRGPDLVKGFE